MLVNIARTYPHIDRVAFIPQASIDIFPDLRIKSVSRSAQSADPKFVLK